MFPAFSAQAGLDAGLAALVMSLIVAVRYVLASGIFAWLSERRAPGLHRRRRKQIGREIGWSLASAAIYGVPAGVLVWGWRTHGWTRIYSDVTAYPLWWLPVSFALCLLLHDGWFYWTHRLMHRPAWFRAMHRVHHDSRPATPWAAMSFHPWEALSGAVVVPMLILLIPLHLSVLGALLGVMTVMGVTNHMEWDVFPGWLVKGFAGRWLITASHHHRHHDSYRCNYGLYFRFWDRLCGTDGGIGGGMDDPRAGG